MSRGADVSVVFVDFELHSKLQSGAEVGRRTRAGQARSWHRAAYPGHTDVVNVLLQHGGGCTGEGYRWSNTPP